MRVLFTKSFKKEYKKLNAKHKAAFDSRLEGFMQNHSDPILNKHKLHGKYKDSFSINISGDVWAIFYLKYNGETAVFIRVGSHAELYE